MRKQRTTSTATGTPIFSSLTLGKRTMRVGFGSFMEAEQTDVTWRVGAYPPGRPIFRGGGVKCGRCQRRQLPPTLL